MFKIIRKQDTKTTLWSGGTTTQLAIFPEDGDYAKRCFIWRVSSARVEVDESEFTSLPGVERCLMILDGKLWLSHEGRYEMNLERFQQDNFNGGWKTVSRGRVTDFNLMVTDGEGRLQVLEIEPKASKVITASGLVPEWEMISEVFYFLSDGVEVAITGESVKMNRGDVLLHAEESSNTVDTLSFTNFFDVKAEVIRAVIYHNR